MKKIAWGVGAATALAVGAWAGTGVYLGVQAHDSLQRLAAPPSAKTDSAWRISQMQHQRGLFQSSGQFLLAYSPACASQPGKDDSTTLQVSYTLSHLPSPGGAARFQWQLTPQGDAAQTFKTLFGAASALNGQGSVSLTGVVRTDMNLPGVTRRQSGQALEITPSSGSLEMNGQQLAMQWRTDRLVMRGNGQAYDLQGIALDLTLDDRSKGTGSGSLKVARSNASLGTLEGLDLSVEAREKGDRLHMNFTPSLRKLEVGTQVLTDLRMQWALNGLHTASAERLVQLLEDSCGLESMTADESKAAAQAAQALLAKGFTFGMSKLTGKAANGSLEGSFIVELVAASGSTPSLPEQLRSSGKIEIKGAVITPQQREIAVGTGFAVAQGDSLSADYEYAKGVLKVNNRAIDASFVAGVVTRLDEDLRNALAPSQGAAR
jgi:hypothetical protein